MTDLFRRGLEGTRFEMICVDGGAGLFAGFTHENSNRGVPSLFSLTQTF